MVNIVKGQQELFVQVDLKCVETGGADAVFA